MTDKTAFSEAEWKVVLEGPPSAGMVVITASKGGMFKETWAMSKTYAEARTKHGSSELLDAIVSAKPETDHTKYHTPEEVRTHGLEHIRASVALVKEKGTAEELDAYQKFVLTLCDHVAAAHKESGVAVNEAEKSAISEISSALGVTA